MEIRDLSPKDIEELPEEKLDSLLLSQGAQVLATVNTPGWAIIENILIMERHNVEKEGIAAVRGQTTKEKGIFHFGEVSGIIRATERVYEAIEKAKQVQAKRDHLEKAED